MGLIHQTFIKRLHTVGGKMSIGRLCVVLCCVLPIFGELCSHSLWGPLGLSCMNMVLYLPLRPHRLLRVVFAQLSLFGFLSMIPS